MAWVFDLMANSSCWTEIKQPPAGGNCPFGKPRIALWSKSLRCAVFVSLLPAPAGKTSPGATGIDGRAPPNSLRCQIRHGGLFVMFERVIEIVREWQVTTPPPERTFASSGKLLEPARRRPARAMARAAAKQSIGMAGRNQTEPLVANRPMRARQASVVARKRHGRRFAASYRCRPDRAGGRKGNASPPELPAKRPAGPMAWVPERGTRALVREQLRQGPRPEAHVLAVAEGASCPERSLITAADALGVRTHRGQRWLPSFKNVGPMLPHGGVSGTKPLKSRVSSAVEQRFCKRLAAQQRNI